MVSEAPPKPACADPAKTPWVSPLSVIREDGVLLWTAMLGTLYRRTWLITTATSLLLLIGCVVLWPRDAAILHEVRHSEAGDWHEQRDALARFLSHWGDFFGFTLGLALALWIAGRMRRARYWQRLATASLMSAVLAGTSANVARFTLGRPRPAASLEDKFYGPQLQNRFHAFPSAHTATALGSALPVLMAAPMLGVPVTLFAGGVAWSRMYRNQHHPTDVAVAGWIATVFGVPLGLAVRRSRRRGVDLGS